MKKKRKSVIALIALFVIVGILITGGILAYLTDIDHKTNVFTVGSVKINITESNWDPSNGENILPGQPINKDPAIQNIGKNSAYVYMKIEQPSVELANNTEGPLFDYTINNGWTLLGTNTNQGCPTTTSVYYYNTALNKNTTTSTLFDSVTINDFGELSDTYEMNIEVTGYAIQSSYLPSGTTIQSAYSTYFDNSGLVGCTTPIIMPFSENDTPAFKSETYRYAIKTVTLDNQINEPADVVDSWDIGVHQNGDVMAYVVPNSDDDEMLDLYIQGNGSLYANPDSSYLFAELRSVDSINGMDKLNLSKVTNMEGMFFATGYTSQVFTLDLGDKFDTRNVTNMSKMFLGTGYYDPNFTLDLGDKFDTSKVTNMSDMFSGAGAYSATYFLNLGDKFDTRNVTNMSGMFYAAGNFNPLFTLDLGNKFDTSKVTNMNLMFADTGRSSSIFTLDLGNKFDTRNVTDMTRMFSCTGYDSPLFTLTLGNKFDTSKVTNMLDMFLATGYSSSLFILDLGDKFDTSKVTNMAGMFEQTGYTSSIFTLNLGDKFETNLVTDMSHMFYNTGYSNSNLVLDLSTFNFGNVTRYNSIFTGMRSTGKIYVGNSTARSWIINNSGNSALTSSNVLIKP